MSECKKIVNLIKNNYSFILAISVILLAIIGFSYDILFYSVFKIDIISLSSPEDFLFSWIKSGSLLFYCFFSAVTLISYQITYCSIKNKSIKLINIYLLIMTIFVVLTIGNTTLLDVEIFKFINFEKLEPEVASRFLDYFLIVLIITYVGLGFLFALVRVRLSYCGINALNYKGLIIFITILVFISNLLLSVENDTKNVGQIKNGFYIIKQVNEKSFDDVKYMMIGMNSNYYFFFRIIKDKYFNIKIINNSQNSFHSNSKDDNQPPIVIIPKDKIEQMTFFPVD